jgi:O-antigen/teichoic acid export membrane protein
MATIDGLGASRLFNGLVQGIVSGALGIAVGIALARVMKMEDFGEYSAALSMLGITSLFAVFGLGEVAMKVTRHAYAVSDFALVRGFGLRGIQVIVTASVFAIVVLVGVHAAMHHETAVRFWSFVAVIGLLPLMALIELYAAAATAHGAAVAANALSGWVRCVIQLCFLGIAVLVWGTRLDVLEASAVLAATSIMTVVGLWVLRNSNHPRAHRKGAKVFETWIWVKSGATFTLATLGVVLIDKGGLVIMGWVHADGVAAARLAAAIQLAVPILFIGFAAYSIFKPPLVDALARGKSDEVRRVLRRWHACTLPVSVGYLVLLIFFGDEVLGIYGEGFRRAHTTSIVLAVVYTVNVSFDLIHLAAIQFAGRGRAAVLITSSWAAVSLALMVILGEHWSELGVALATLLGVIGVAASTLFLLRAVLRDGLSLTAAGNSSSVG